MKKVFQGCLVIVVVVVLIGVVVALVGGGGDGDKSDTTASEDTNTTPKKPKNVLDPEAGKANRVKKGGTYTLGDFKIHKGWTVEKIGSGFGWTVKGLDIENVTDSDHSFSADIKLHKGAHRIVASITCLANEAHPKEIVTADCLPDGDEKPYDYITIENSF